MSDRRLIACALHDAEKIQRDAKSLGFDWPDVFPVFDKVAEELSEVKDALATKQYEDVEEEVGDLLFAAVNLARHLNVSPSHALVLANQKFSLRFEDVKHLAAIRNINMAKADIALLEALWTEVKSAQNK
jgi:ATP diphosphatase